MATITITVSDRDDPEFPILVEFALVEGEYDEKSRAIQLATIIKDTFHALMEEQK